MLGGIEGKRRRGWQKMRWLDGITDSMSEWTPGDGDGQGGLAAIHGVAKSWTQLSDWTELNWMINDVGHVFTCLSAICIFFFEEMLKDKLGETTCSIQQRQKANNPLMPHQVAKVLKLQLPHQSFQWIFRINWFDLLEVQGTLKSPLQHHSSKASILQHST